jgi:hypothetical protein
MTLLMAKVEELPVFMIILFVTVGAVVFLISASQRKSLNATLERIAQRLGGSVVEGGLFSQPGLSFQLEGRSARVEFYGGSKNSPPYSKVVVHARGASPGVLHILEQGFGQSFLKLFGAQDLEIGDREFDHDYVIKATPAVLATRLFSPDRRLDGMRIVRRLRGYSRGTFDLDSQSVTVMVRQFLREESDVMTLITCAKDFAAFVLGAQASVEVRRGEIVMDEVRMAAGTDCPVCGTAMNSATVRCELCRTPHHTECWQYMGRCSTYACQGRRSVA